MNQKEIAYLAGSCRNVSIEERNKWREYLVETLKNNANNIIAFSPNEHFAYEKCGTENEKTVMDYFLYRLKNSGIMVLNLNNSDKSVGTGIEFGYALAKEKLIIGFGTENIYEYMREKCSAVFNDVDETADFLLEHIG